MDISNKASSVYSTEYTRKLAAVFALLIKSKDSDAIDIKDDTYLCKLADLLNNEFKTSSDFNTEPNEDFKNFLKVCSDDKSCSAIALNLCLRILPHIPESVLKDYGGRTAYMQGVTNNVLTSAAFTESVVKDLWLKCNTQLVGNGAEITILSDHIKTVFSCLHDKSFFVSNSAKLLLCRIIKSLLDEQETVDILKRTIFYRKPTDDHNNGNHVLDGGSLFGNSNGVQSEAKDKLGDKPSVGEKAKNVTKLELQKEILNGVVHSIFHWESKDAAHVKTCLKVLFDLCNESGMFSQWVLENTDIFVVLQDVMMKENHAGWNLGVQLLKVLYSTESSSGDLTGTLQALQHRLNAGKQTELGLEIAGWICRHQLQQPGYRYGSSLKMLLEPVQTMTSPGTRTSESTLKKILTIIADNNLHIHYEGEVLETIVDFFHHYVQNSQERMTNKILLPCLQIIQEYLQNSGEATVKKEDLRTKLLEALFAILDNSLSNSVLLQKTFECVVELISICLKKQVDILDAVLHSEGSSSKFGENLSSILQKKLMDLQWESRDTALDVINTLVQRFAETQQWQEWFVSSKLLECAWECTSDTEDYVQASSVMVLTSLLTHSPQLWQAFIRDHSQDEILSKIQNILKDEGQTCARKNSMKLLGVLYDRSQEQESCDHRERITSMINERVLDSDWEVKTSVIQHWKEFIDKNVFVQKELAIPSYAIGITENIDRVKISESKQEKFETFCQKGGAKVLLIAAEDPDVSVQKSACELLACLSKNISYDPDFELSNTNTEKRSKIYIEPTLPSDWSMEHEQFFSILCGTDWQEKVDQASCSTDHYLGNPASLLDDILCCVQDLEEGKQVIIDCY